MAEGGDGAARPWKRPAFTTSAGCWRFSAAPESIRRRMPIVSTTCRSTQCLSATRTFSMPSRLTARPRSRWSMRSASGSLLSLGLKIRSKCSVEPDLHRLRRLQWLLYVRLNWPPRAHNLAAGCLGRMPRWLVTSPCLVAVDTASISSSANSLRLICCRRPCSLRAVRIGLQGHQSAAFFPGGVSRCARSP